MYNIAGGSDLGVERHMPGMPCRVLFHSTMANTRSAELVMFVIQRVQPSLRLQEKSASPCASPS